MRENLEQRWLARLSMHGYEAKTLPGKDFHFSPLFANLPGCYLEVRDRNGGGLDAEGFAALREYVCDGGGTLFLARDGEGTPDCYLFLLSSIVNRIKPFLAEIQSCVLESREMLQGTEPVLASYARMGELIKVWDALVSKEKVGMVIDDQQFEMLTADTHRVLTSLWLETERNGKPLHEEMLHVLHELNKFAVPPF